MVDERLRDHLQPRHSLPQQKTLARASKGHSMPDTSNMSDDELDLWSDINNPNNDADMDDWADAHNPNNDEYLGD